MKSLRVCIVVALAILVPSGLLADTDLLGSFEDKTTLHRLDNGWTFLIVERPVAPVFSFTTVVDVGSAREVPGITGLAHMFEHMAFKGTPNIGTHDFAAEKVALERVEEAYEAYDRARRRPDADPAEVEKLQGELERRQEEAGEHVVVNEFADIIEREGGVGLNASTSRDFTLYTYSLPANKLELFAYLESERFLHPVFREFYKERDVVQEERRQRTDSQPIGRLLEQTLATAFVAHPYKQPTIGYMSDLRSITATDAQEFFETYYVPSNMVTSVVGHLRAEEVIPVLEKYFGRIPARPAPPALRTVEPEQIAEKQVVLKDLSQPFYMETYHRPSAHHEDDAVYAAIDDVLSNGRTSRLYRSLVRDLQVAAFAGSFSGLPGRKYPHLWLALAVPGKDHGNDAVRDALQAELERLQEEPISEAELDRFRTRAKADLLRQLRSNNGLARQLALDQTLFGDWRRSFRFLGEIDEVTAADIQRVAQATFVDSNRTVGMIFNEANTKKTDATAASNTADSGGM